MTRSIDVQFRLNGLIRKDPEAGVYVTYCPALSIYSQDVTESEAKESMRSAILLFLTTCYERGTLGQEFKKLGLFVAAPGTPIREADEFIALREKFKEEFDVEVPMHLLAAASTEGVECRH